MEGEETTVVADPNQPPAAYHLANYAARDYPSGPGIAALPDGRTPTQSPAPHATATTSLLARFLGNEHVAAPMRHAPLARALRVAENDSKSGNSHLRHVLQCLRRTLALLADASGVETLVKWPSRAVLTRESHAGSVGGPSRSAPRARRRSRKSPRCAPCQDRRCPSETGHN